MADRLARVDPGSLSDDEAGAWLALAGEVERLGAGLRLRVADRAVRSGVWSADGHRSPAAWVAAVTGTSVADGRSTLATSARLDRLPATSRAASRGALSGAQVKLITDAGSLDPAREQELIDTAADMGTDALKHAVRNERVTTSMATGDGDAPGSPAPSPSATGRRRFLRWWNDTEGLVRLAGAFEAEEGAALMSAVRSRAVFVADDAMAAGLEPEVQAAYDADALVALATGDVRHATFAGDVGAGNARSTLVLHARLDAVRGGEPGPGAICEIEGVGPVSLAMVETWAGDAQVRLVVEDADRVVGSAELGPAVPDEVRRLLEERDRSCVVPGCAVALGLRTVFWHSAYVEGGPAELWNLARLCCFHHRLKSNAGFSLVGGPGRWEWRPPP